jgi:hypothetical protein
MSSVRKRLQSLGPVFKPSTYAGGCCAVVSQPNSFYRIADLDGGRYSLWVEAKGYTLQWILEVVVDVRVTRKDIQLKRELPTK